MPDPTVRFIPSEGAPGDPDFEARYISTALAIIGKHMGRVVRRDEVQILQNYIVRMKREARNGLV